MKKHLVWLLGMGTGVLACLCYKVVLSLSTSFVLSAIIAIFLSIVSVHVCFQFLIQSSRKNIYMMAAEVGLVFEFMTVFATALFPDEEILPTLVQFITPYVSIFITTVLIIILLIIWGKIVSTGVFKELRLKKVKVHHDQPKFH